MKTVLLADDRDLDTARVRRSRLRDRVRVHLRALALNRALAEGANPDSDLLLSLRAEALMSMSNRQTLGQALRRLVADAGRPIGPMGPVLPLDRRAILRHRSLIHEMADVLEQPGPVDLRGVAAVETLVRDGAGPLYTADRKGALGARLQALRSLLATPPAGTPVA
jgi:hypothetical protein